MTDPDHKLAKKAGRGDTAALAALYRRYRRRLMGYLLGMLQDPQLAEDVFLAVWVAVDANRRGLNGFLWGLLVFFTHIIGLIIYLIAGNGGGGLGRPAPTPADAPPPPPVLKCRSCRAEVNSDFQVCPYCGVSLKCRQCERTLQPDWKLCPYCTTPVGEETGPQPSRE